MYVSLFHSVSLCFVTSIFQIVWSVTSCFRDFPLYLICFICYETEMGLYKKQEAYGPRVAHLSDIATADMQMLCNIFPILSSQLMKKSSFKQFLILKKNIYGMPVDGA